MKGKITTTTTAKPTTIKGYTPTVQTVAGTWIKIDQYGCFVWGTEKKLGTQNGFRAVHQLAGMVFVVSTGADKGIWRKREPSNS